LANEGKIFKSHASTRYSSANNESTGHFDLNFGREKWASYTSVTYSDFGDLKMGSHGPDGYLRHEYVIRENGEDKIVENSDPEKQVPTAYDQLNLMQKFKFVPNEDLNIDYGFHYSKTSDVERYDRHLQYNDDQLKYGDWYYGPQVWLMNNLQVSHKGKGSWYDDMRMIMAHQFFKESRHTRKLNKEDISRRTEKVHAYSFNVDFNKKLSSGKRLMYGAELVYNNNSSKGVDENIITGAKVSLDSRYPDDSDWLSAAIYANYTQKLGSKTNLQAGLRYNYIYLHTEFSDEFFDFQFDQSTLNNGALTGSLGVVHNPNENWQLSSSISTGFRSPNLDDVGKIFDSEPGSVVVPNPDLEPEYAINGEMGAAVVIRERLKLDWAVYYTYLNNAMVRDDFLFNGEEEIDYEGELSQVQAIQNAANAYVYGLQGGFEYKITEGLSASSRINYQKGEEETEDGIDSPLRHAAPWFGTTHLRYKREALKLDLNAQYNGEIANKDMPLTELSKTYMYAIDGNGNPYSPSWMVLNFRAQYAINHYTNLTAGIENILDKRYRPYSSGIVAPGRNFVVSLNLTL
jgi:hemoglobin/transferrin/lactoferrin receptor protein